MKTLKLTLVFTGMLLLSSLFQSCLSDDGQDYSYYYPNALVTAKNASDGTFYLQLDDSTTLLPVNMKTSPFGGKEVRALVNYQATKDPSSGYNQAVHINWIDSILTKSTVPDQGIKNDSIYGSDPVEIMNDWVTLAEDGYLTLHFRTVWGDNRIAHSVNLLTGVNPSNPYEVEFRQNAHGDVYGRPGDALVAFNLKNLPDTQGKTVKLKLNWKSFSGNKSVEFDYCSRKGSVIKMQVGNTQFIKLLK